MPSYLQETILETAVGISVYLLELVRLFNILPNPVDYIFLSALMNWLSIYASVV